ncbi:unnamed protein product, partial [Acanthoscelides obtectus]
MGCTLCLRILRNTFSNRKISSSEELDILLAAQRDTKHRQRDASELLLNSGIMKRHKPSGDFYRKQKKAREEENKKKKGSLLKYFDSTTETAESEVDREASTSATPNQKAVSSSSGGLTEFEDLPNEPAVVGEQLKLLVEDESYEVIDTLDIQDGSISDYKDIGTWPISIT